ncbi:MAG: flagellar motor switch protein FliN [Desulfuromusa sp.]|jgi:flagellar motor switch protein FliN/FliY|nr:flagellar motor switch protein FliN [Desulfuromusa sp.]
MSDGNLENGQPADVEASKGRFDDRGIDLLLDIPLEVSVEVGRSRILVRDLLQLQEGSLVELNKLAGEPLDLYVNSRLIARGEAVVVNEKFGLRLTDVVSPSERIEKLG